MDGLLSEVITPVSTIVGVGVVVWATLYTENKKRRREDREDKEKMREKLGEVNTTLTNVKEKCDNLPCKDHSKRIGDNSRAIARVEGRLNNRS